MLSHQTSSTLWTPRTWWWQRSAAIGTVAVNAFLFPFWVESQLLHSSPAFLLLSFSSQCRPDVRFCARLLLDARSHCGHHEQGIISQCGLDLFQSAQFVLVRVSQHAWVLLKPSDPASNFSFKVPVELKLLCRFVQMEVMILWWKKHFLLMHLQVARLKRYTLSWINERRLFCQAA